MRSIIIQKNIDIYFYLRAINFIALICHFIYLHNVFFKKIKLLKNGNFLFCFIGGRYERK